MNSQYSLPSLSEIMKPELCQPKKPSVLCVSSLLSPTEYFEPVKAKRKRASPSQLNMLNKVFQQTCFPSTELRTDLARQLGMSPRAVQIWFQNKRQSIRAREKPLNCHILSPPYSPTRLPSFRSPWLESRILRDF